MNISPGSTGSQFTVYRIDPSGISNGVRMSSSAESAEEEDDDNDVAAGKLLLLSPS